MPHIFPPARFRAEEVPDVEALNKTFLTIGAKLAGRLNEQDIDSSTPFAYANLASSCYYTVHHTNAAVDPDLVANNWFLQDGAGADATFTLQDSYAWQPVDDLSLTVSTGEDLLFVIGLVQHAVWSGRAGEFPTTVPGASVTARIQHALRVGGTVVEETITGPSVFPDPPLKQVYRVQADTQDFDWRHVSYIQNCVGINNFANPTRIMAVVPAGPGDTSVDLVSRRIPRSDGKIDDSGTGVYIQFFNRRLAVIRMKGTSAHGGSVSTFSVPAFEDADVLSQASLRTARLDVLRTAINDLGDEALERGALNNEHIPTVVTYPTAKVIDPAAGVNITTIYPGYGAGPVGWTEVDDGAGDNLRVTLNADFSANDGVLVVFANVEVEAVSIAASEEMRALGVLALSYTNSVGTTTFLGETEVYVNAHNPDPNTATTAMRNIHTDIPLMWVVDVSTLSAADQLMDYIRVVGATHDGSGGAAPVTMTTKRASLFAFLLRGVTLSS